LPDVLVQIVAVAGVDARREKGQKQRSMPAVEPFERISGRAKSPLRRIAAGNLGGQLLIAPGRLVHDGCHELRVCETRARQSRGKVFRPSASTINNHGRAQRTDGNDPSKCILVDHNHDGLLFLEDCGHYSSPLALENEPHGDFFPGSHAILRNDNLG
jgi:hypothetical protein